MTREQALYELLISLFTDNAQLQRHLRWLPGGEALVNALPSRDVPMARFVHEAVELLAKLNLVDDAFWAAFGPVYAGRADDIQRVRALWAGAADTIRTEDKPPEQRPTLSRAEALRQRATIGILTALPKELAAVRVMLESPVSWTSPTSRVRYLLGEIPATEGGAHAVAVALLLEMGNNAAALSAQTLLGDVPSARHLVMCGIAGGVPAPGRPDDDVRLGDVVVSNRNGVIQYDLVKLSEGEDPEPRHPPRPPGRELLDAVRHLEAEALMGERPWRAHLARGASIDEAARPDDGLDARGEPIAYPPDPKRAPGLPRVFSGPIAASNALLKDPAIRDRLARDFKVKAIEMEGSGVADAAWFSDRAGYLVIRGVCDYCDERKGDLWQGYAAVAAAAYLRALVASMAA